MPDRRRLAAADFDEVVRQARRRPDELWGLPAIASALGLSVDTVRRWSRDPRKGLPITRPGGRYFATRAALLAWLHRG